MPKALKPERATPGSSAELVPSQLDKFKAAARELGTDDDPERFKDRVKRIGSVKPKADVAEKL